MTKKKAEFKPDGRLIGLLVFAVFLVVIVYLMGS